MVLFLVRISIRPPGNMSSWVSGRLRGRFGYGSHADDRLNVRGFDRPAFLEPLVQRVQRLHGIRLVGLGPVQRQQVAPSHDDDAIALFDLRKVAIVLATQVDQKAIVGKFDQSLVKGFRQN